MTEFDVFERRLAAALTSYASEAEPLPDPFERAQAIASAHPRRSGWRSVARGIPLSRWVWIGVALLLAASVIAYVLIGSRQPRQVVIAVDPANPIPAQLFGLWYPGPRTDGVPTDRAMLDFNASALIQLPGGSPATSLGRAVAFVERGPGNAEVTVQAAGACGEGRYRVALQDPSIPPGLPSPAPLPPGSSSDPATPLGNGDELHVTAVSDECVARLEVLRSAPWLRATQQLRPEAIVSSLQFTEPFHLALPADLPALIGDGVGQLYQPESATRLNVSHAWWNAFFLDDEPVYRDLCDPGAGTLPDIPATVEEATTWLRSTASLGFEEPSPVQIDGRTALRVGKLGDCPNGNIPAVAAGVYGDIFYAIPTGDDVILFVVRPDTQNEADIAAQLARSIVFD